MGHYDLVVVGGGSAGLTAATIAGRVGARVLLVDKTRLGGDCLHHGCVPSKALIRCAKAAHEVSISARFGVHIEGLRVDFAEVMAHVRGAMDRIGRQDSPDALEKLGVDTAFGGARFEETGRLLVAGEPVDAKNIILATGSSPAVPSIEGLEQAGFLDNRSLFDLETLPEKLVVIGAGPIGVEMGQAFARLGSDVTILEMGPRILPREDSDMAALLAKSLSRQLRIVTNAKVTKVARNQGRTMVTYDKVTANQDSSADVSEGNDHGQTLECDRILVAAGRRPNIEELNLDAAGIQYNPNGILVDDTCRTSVKGVWACGDCAGGLQFTHVAEAQARTAARNALFVGKSRVATRVVPWVTFTDPPLASVGLGEQAAGREHRRTDRFEYRYDQLDRALCDGVGTGLAKIVTTPKGVILGATILGPRAGEAISELAVAMAAGMKLQKLGAVIHPYPTYNRVVRRLADERFRKRGVGRWTIRLLGRYHPREGLLRESKSTEENRP